MCIMPNSVGATWVPQAMILDEHEKFVFIAAPTFSFIHFMHTDVSTEVVWRKLRNRQIVFNFTAKHANL